MNIMPSPCMAMHKIVDMREITTIHVVVVQIAV
jgi:hypothetical protein